MADSDQQSLKGWSATSRTFYVTAHKLEISRGWSRDSVIGNKNKAEFSITIHATAIADRDTVCVIGTDREAGEFDLIIRSDAKGMQHWERVKANDIAANSDGETPEERVWNRRNELLERSPPTATLFVTDDDEVAGVKGGWDLECRVPQSVLEKLAADISERRAEAVHLGIDWAAGLVKDEHKWSDENISGYATWGMFKHPGKEWTEPLWGHVSYFNWKIGTAEVGNRQSKTENLTGTRDEWIKSFAAECKAEREPWMSRDKRAIEGLAWSITKWCEKQGESAEDLRSKLDECRQFVQRLDGALHQKEGPFPKEKQFLWCHRDVAELFRKKKRRARLHLVASSEFTNLITEYIETPWLHNGHLAWVFLDAMAASDLVAAVDMSLQLEHGDAYVSFNGVRWKMVLRKLITRPLWFLVSLVLPAILIHDLLASQSIWVVIGAGIAVYGFVGWLVARSYWSKSSERRRLATLVDEQDRVYALLAGPLLHVGEIRKAFERSIENGVAWDQRSFYILDQVTERGAGIWDLRNLR